MCSRVKFKIIVLNEEPVRRNDIHRVKISLAALIGLQRAILLLFQATATTQKATSCRFQSFKGRIWSGLRGVIVIQDFVLQNTKADICSLKSLYVKIIFAVIIICTIQYALFLNSCLAISIRCYLKQINLNISFSHIAFSFSFVHLLRGHNFQICKVPHQLIFNKFF